MTCDWCILRLYFNNFSWCQVVWLNLAGRSWRCCVCNWTISHYVKWFGWIWPEGAGDVVYVTEPFLITSSGLVESGRKELALLCMQSWALAHFFEVRFPLPTQFFTLDRWRSCVHFLNFPFRSSLKRSSLKRSSLNQWIAERKRAKSLIALYYKNEVFKGSVQWKGRGSSKMVIVE
jgi:hypothetical protein